MITGRAVVIGLEYRAGPELALNREAPEGRSRAREWRYSLATNRRSCC